MANEREAECRWWAQDIKMEERDEGCNERRKVVVLQVDKPGTTQEKSVDSGRPAMAMRLASERAPI